MVLPHETSYHIFMEQKMMLECFLCDQEIASVDEQGVFQYEGGDHGATIFHASGNYGSPFDPFNASPTVQESLNIVLCDECLIRKTKQKKIVELTVRTRRVATAVKGYYELES